MAEFDVDLFVIGGGSGGVFVMVGNWHAQSPSRQVVNAKEVFYSRTVRPQSDGGNCLRIFPTVLRENGFFRSFIGFDLSARASTTFSEAKRRCGATR